MANLEEEMNSIRFRNLAMGPRKDSWFGAVWRHVDTAITAQRETTNLIKSILGRLQAIETSNYAVYLLLKQRRLERLSFTDGVDSETPLG